MGAEGIREVTSHECTPIGTSSSSYIIRCSRVARLASASRSGTWRLLISDGSIHGAKPTSWNGHNGSASPLFFSRTKRIVLNIHGVQVLIVRAHCIQRGEEASCWTPPCRLCTLETCLAGFWPNLNYREPAGAEIGAAFPMTSLYGATYSNRIHYLWSRFTPRQATTELPHVPNSVLSRALPPLPPVLRKVHRCGQKQTSNTRTAAVKLGGQGTEVSESCPCQGGLAILRPCRSRRVATTWCWHLAAGGPAP